MKVTLSRIDTRLVHGQVCMKWSKAAEAQNIFVVDKLAASDPMMIKLFKGAVPNNIKTLEIFTPEEMMKSYKANTLADGNAFLIFRDVQNCYELFKLGFPFDAIDIGNQAMKPGKTQVLREVFLSDKEYDMIKEMNDSGIDVYIQIIPELARYDFKTITSKMKK